MRRKMRSAATLIALVSVSSLLVRTPALANDVTYQVEQSSGAAAAAVPTQPAFQAQPRPQPGQVALPPAQVSMGLVQVGVAMVAQSGAVGGFSQPMPMPIYRFIQLQTPGQPAPAHVARPGPVSSGAAIPQAATKPVAAPQPPAQAAGSKNVTKCVVNGVLLLTETQAACKAISGNTWDVKVSRKGS